MIELLWASRVMLQHSIILLLAGYAFWRGAGPERMVASVFLGMLAISYTYQAIVPVAATFRTIAPNALLQDAFGFIVLFIVALYANRMYPLWIAALQLLALLSHSNRHLSAQIDPFVYALLIRLPLYIQLAILALGLAAHRRRVRVYGRYRAWRTDAVTNMGSERRRSAEADAPKRAG